MTGKNITPVAQIIHEKTYPRFNLGQRAAFDWFAAKIP